MQLKTRKLVIVGDGEMAEIAYEYFTHDSTYEVSGFVVERAYLKRDRLYELAVTAFEDLPSRYAPADYDVYVALSSTQLNRPRARLYHEVKRLGYRCASYVSSHAFVWRNVELGENTFIFENNVLQHHVRVGNNVILWSGNHVGHRTVIGDHAFLSSHVVVSGFCEIGESCFMGVNSCVGNNLKIAKDCIVGAGAVVVKDTEPGKVYVGNPAKPMQKDSYATFGVREP